MASNDAAVLASETLKADALSASITFGEESESIGSDAPDKFDSHYETGVRDTTAQACITRQWLLIDMPFRDSKFGLIMRVLSRLHLTL